MLVAACLSHAGRAGAQSSERGVAQSLFEEGVRLMRAKQYSEACPKLAESQRLEPAGGTLFNLALCLEEDGKLASAYVAYDEALARAKNDGNKPRSQIIERRMTALRPRLSRVTVTVARGAAGAQLDVRFDGTPIKEQAWGVPFYADVGAHTVTAAAPGRRPFRGEVRVEAAAKSYELNVPELEAEPVVAAPGSAPRAEGEPSAAKEGPKAGEGVEAAERPAGAEAPSSGRGPLPWILVGSGALLLGAGAVSGALAFSRHGDSDAGCPGGRCTAQGVRDEEQANAFAWVANVTIPLGVVAGAVGTYLLLRKPQHVGVSARGGARVVPTSSGLVLYGAF